jgi:hypothetical protein
VNFPKRFLLGFSSLCSLFYKVLELIAKRLPQNNTAKKRNAGSTISEFIQSKTRSQEKSFFLRKFCCFRGITSRSIKVGNHQWVTFQRKVAHPFSPTVRRQVVLPSVLESNNDSLFFDGSGEE